eukprot:m.5990 g.5990  ORF g.5990 m.5990 type:complete len:50 (-) comp2525_c0_seq1:1423-1572(-)
MFYKLIKRGSPNRFKLFTSADVVVILTLRFDYVAFWLLRVAHAVMYGRG